ncbi:MAG TPA: alpha/beta fold hydrolase [Vicinamibacterales bacterium]
MNSTAVRSTVVFVHGIFSSGVIFKDMSDACTARGVFEACVTFEYDYHRDLEDNAQALTDLLARIEGPVVLVCHSMGGLVARLAVLSGDAPTVRRVIMLATPNFGAMRTATAGLLAQLVLQATGRVSAVFRHPGILELTRISQLMKEPIATGETFARGVEYVSLPARYFHEGRAILDCGDWADGRMSTRLFAALGVGFELLALFPLWAPQIQRPHDGIVEERSNAFVPEGAGRRSEKHASIVDPEKWGYTYAHVSIERCDDLNHVMIHSDPEVIELVVALAAAESLSEWYADLTVEQRLEITVQPTPPGRSRIKRASSSTSRSSSRVRTTAGSRRP